MNSPDAYDSTRLRGQLTYTRVYLPTGHYAHLRADDGGQRILCEIGRYPCCYGKRCCCGLHTEPLPYDALPDPGCTCPHALVRDGDAWLGTGNQDEYEKAAALPLCPLCFMTRERQLPDSRLGTGHRTEMS